MPRVDPAPSNVMDTDGGRSGPAFPLPSVQLQVFDSLSDFQLAWTEVDASLTHLPDANAESLHCLANVIITRINAQLSPLFNALDTLPKFLQENIQTPLGALNDLPTVVSDTDSRLDSVTEDLDANLESTIGKEVLLLGVADSPTDDPSAGALSAFQRIGVPTGHSAGAVSIVSARRFGRFSNSKNRPLCVQLASAEERRRALRARNTWLSSHSREDTRDLLLLPNLTERQRQVKKSLLPHLPTLRDNNVLFRWSHGYRLQVQRVNPSTARRVWLDYDPAVHTSLTGFVTRDGFGR